MDLVYELLYAGNLLPTEVTREVDDVPSRLPHNAMAQRVAKAVALLEAVTDLPRTPRNLAAVLHPRIDADSQLSGVEAALKQLEAAQIVRESEEGFKLLTIQEKHGDTTRRGLDPKPADRHRIIREILQEVFADPSMRGYRYQNRKAFPLALAVDGTVVEGSGQIPLNFMVAEDSEDVEAACEDARHASNETRHELFWVCVLTDEVHRLIEDLYRSREMVSMLERLAAQGKLTPEEASCLADEKVRRDRFQRALRTRLAERVMAGTGFFQGVRKDASVLGQTLAEIFAKLRDDAIPALYPKFDMGNRPVTGDEAEKILTAGNLSGLPPAIHQQQCVPCRILCAARSARFTNAHRGGAAIRSHHRQRGGYRTRCPGSGVPAVSDRGSRYVAAVGGKDESGPAPWEDYLVEFQETLEGILEMPTDDCVKTLAGEGNSYQEARARVQRLHDLLTLQHLQLLRAARRILDGQYPVLKAHEASEEIVQAEVELRDTLESERFYKHLDVVRHTAGLLKNRYQALYTQFHQQRLGAYTAAVEEIKGLPEWAQVANWVASVDEPVVREERHRHLDAVLGRLMGKLCDTLDLSEESDACRTGRGRSHKWGPKSPPSRR